MRRLGLVPLVAVGLVWGGCAGLPPAEPAPQPKPAEVQKPEPPPAPELDPRQERKLVNELLRDVDEYYRLLKEKEVERAAGYVEEAQRRAHLDGLWELVGRYEIVSADVASYQLFPQPEGVFAKVRVVRTLIPRYSVTPERSEIWMTWVRKGERWVLQPQAQK